MRHYYIVIAILSICVFTGCASQKDIAYMQNSATVDLSKSQGLYDLRIIPQDVLNISVVSQDLETCKIFNKRPRNTSDTQLAYTDSLAMGSVDPFIVDTNGDIDYPMIGKLHIAGMTESQAGQLITAKILPYFSKSKTDQPIVTCRLKDFTISVLGEVKNPGSYVIENEKVNILEALALSGDLTIYGKRNNLKLIRQNTEKGVEVHTIDLTDANFINSPYYYMQQNDVLYIEPNKAKGKESKIGDVTGLWIRGTNISISLASLIVSILNN
jgi:polysaccharide export outer membrane protein